MASPERKPARQDSPAQRDQQAQKDEERQAQRNNPGNPARPGEPVTRQRSELDVEAHVDAVDPAPERRRPEDPRRDSQP